MSRAVDKGDKHTEKASDSPPFWSSFMIASIKSWIEEKGGVVKKEGEEGGEEEERTR